MEVSFPLLLFRLMTLISIVSFTGRCHPGIKEELKSPTQPAAKKRKAYSTTDTSAIGSIESTMGFDLNPPQPAGKRQKSAAGSSSQVQFDGVAVPPARATRRSARTTKANSKKDIHELFEQLGQEFGAVTKTCEEIMEAFE